MDILIEEKSEMMYQIEMCKSQAKRYLYDATDAKKVIQDMHHFIDDLQADIKLSTYYDIVSRGQTPASTLSIHANDTIAHIEYLRHQIANARCDIDNADNELVKLNASIADYESKINDINSRLSDYEQSNNDKQC